MCCEDCVSRRAFLARSGAVAAAALVVAACGDGQLGPTQPGGGTTGANQYKPGGGPVNVKVGDIAALASNNVLVQVADRRAARRTGPASFAALSMICGHQFCTVAIVNNAFSCPCHGSQFAIDGTRTAGPTQRNLEVLTTSYDAGTDILTIE